MKLVRVPDLLSAMVLAHQGYSFASVMRRTTSTKESRQVTRYFVRSYIPAMCRPLVDKLVLQSHSTGLSIEQLTAMAEETMATSRDGHLQKWFKQWAVYTHRELLAFREMGALDQIIAYDESSPPCALCGKGLDAHAEVPHENG